MDKASGLLRLDRVLYSAVFYPANYGFIPKTYCDDCDPLDILVLGQDAVPSMCIMTARPIAVMQMKDDDEEDDKIIAIHENDPAYAHIREIEDLPEHTLRELRRFFQDYKKLEHGDVRIELMLGRADAHEVIERSVELYQQSFFPGGEPRPDAPPVGNDKA
jgi:inorganic pyrophosphatase